LILGCLRSLINQTYPDFQTIVVDNGSSDGSVDAVSNEFPQVKVVRLPANEGFSYATNLGVRESNGEILAFLNNDAEADPDWINAGMQVFQNHPEIGILASRIMDYHQRDVIQNAGIKIRRSGRPAGLGRGQKFGGQWATTREVFGASGGAMMVRRSVWEKVGPFREDFVSYLEDVDWAFRARLMGEKCRYVPKMVVYHREAATSDTSGKHGVDSPERVRLIARNKVWVLWLNTPWVLLISHIPWIIGGLLLSLTYHTFRSKHLGAFLMGTFEGKWGQIPRWNERRKILGKRVIGVKELAKWYRHE
jgi:GT2 family glycosyltransferase